MTKGYRRSRTDYPDGVLGVYDNGGVSIDRYTVVYTPDEVDGSDLFTYVNMSTDPFWPQGVCQHGEMWRRPIRIRGKERVITFDALPEDCQRVVKRDLEAWS